MKIIVDRDSCLSIASCVGLGPDVYELDPEGKATIKGVTPEKKGNVWIYEYKGTDINQVVQGAESCPYMAIKVIDDQGKQIYPAQEK